jgi:aminoglycoside phosphotransferase
MTFKMSGLRKSKSGAYTARKVIPKDARIEYERMFGKRCEERFYAKSGASHGEAKAAHAAWINEIELRIERRLRFRGKPHGSGSDDPPRMCLPHRCRIMTTDAPNRALAADLATAALGRPPIDVRRFSTGAHHYVFEAAFADRPPVVVRIAAEHSRVAMVGALRLSNLLRPLGVPLPEIIAEGVSHHFSHIVMERLPGTDLGDVIGGLSDSNLDAIATKVAQAQEIASRTARGTRYGYGIGPADAPHERWSQVLLDNLARSRRRIAAARLFDEDVVRAMADMVSAARTELDALPPVPFLHDTTTRNVIVTPGGSFSGIVDVDDLCFGDPRYVAALTLASLRAMGGPTRYVDAWMNAANQPIDRIFRLYVALFLVDFMSEHGQEFNGNAPPSSVACRKRLLAVFAESLRCID